MKGTLQMAQTWIFRRAITVTCWICILGSGLSACANTAQMSKDQWLQNNFPNRSKNLEKTGYQDSVFRDSILAGQVSTGMNLEEILIARAIAPYGPAQNKSQFWCEKLSYFSPEKCPKGCSDCTGIIQTKSDLLLLQQKGQRLIAVAHKKSGTLRTEPGISQRHFNNAEAIFQQKFVTGMTLNQVKLSNRSPFNQTIYYCNDIPSHACDSHCVSCRVEIQSLNKVTLHVRTLYFDRTHTLTRIIEKVR